MDSLKKWTCPGGPPCPLVSLHPISSRPALPCLTLLRPSPFHSAPASPRRPAPTTHFITVPGGIFYAFLIPVSSEGPSNYIPL
ncbi:hypothetical protein E2C01_012212 [Portunus trituberculatus]|uniref:Uncharacterized protein n=1 Tax=Portunus trituberculatus TaxID=210409 RepID=A0A5B7DD88_PORTR|nr:hypothetical protein [Portunus trituberculatus]